VLATGFSTDYFNNENTEEGLESLQPSRVPTPKTVSGAKKFAEKSFSYDNTPVTLRKDRAVSEFGSEESGDSASSSVGGSAVTDDVPRIGKKKLEKRKKGGFFGFIGRLFSD